MNILIDGQTLTTPEMDRGIGQVFKRLLEGMVVPDISHNWFIAVHDLEKLDRLSHQAQQALEPLLLPPLKANGEQIEWCWAYGKQLQKIIDQYEIDLYWNPNPLMVNVYYPFGISCKNRAFTLYDIIPLVYKEIYLERWTAGLRGDYLARLDDMANFSDLILTISDFTKEDFKKYYPVKGIIKNIYLSSDFSLMWPYLQGCSLSDDPYILYVGGFDPRKNMENALRAFAKFVQSWHPQQINIQLKIVCAYQKNEKNALLEIAKQLNVASQIEFTGFIDDHTLGRLFRNAHLFFFPSLYEGFGLPLLDAMACGVPVVASQISSIPEVCGDLAIYCNPFCVEDMANKLKQAWDNREKNLLPDMKLVEHARQFHWGKTCQEYLKAFTYIAENNTQISPQSSRKYRVAYLSPWPPLKNGIADYSYSLVKELKNLCEIFVFYPEQEISMDLMDDGLNIPILPVSSFRKYKDLFDTVIYHIGNNPAHVDIYQLAWEIPGIVVIHDYNIHSFFQHCYLGKKNQEWLYRESLYWYGDQGRAAWQSYQQAGEKPKVFGFACTEALVAKSKAAIVHNRWTAKKFKASGLINVFPSHLGTHFRSSTLQEQCAETYNAFNLDKNSFYVGVFGFINLHKRLEPIIASISKLVSDGYPVILLIVGEINDTRVNIKNLMEIYKLSPESLIHTSYVDSDNFDKYLSICDVLINLRYPTMGESSGSLFRSFTFGVPSIVSNINQFSELPDSIVWKADVENDEIEQVVAYIKHLCQNPEVRTSMGKKAEEFIKSFCCFDKISKEYYKLIQLVVEEIL